jgi:hypothetical protein
MSNPTTPFGWVMPEATDLVTNLPADFEVFGQAVATSMADLLGGTTGQVLKKNTNADMDFVWSADSAGMTNPMTTTGDTIYSSPGSTPVRLGIGTANQVLAVNSGATAPEWKTVSSGGMTLLSTTTLSGASTTISSIDQTYKSIVMYFYLVNQSDNASFYIRPNNSSTLVNAICNYAENGSTYAIATNSDRVQLPGNLGQNSTVNAWTLTFDNYASTTSFKPFRMNGYYEYPSSSIKTAFNMGGGFRSTTAISSIVIAPASGTFSAGTVLLYGVN